MSKPTEGRLRRLAEELEESGLRLDLPAAVRDVVIAEIDQALRPHVHERRVPSGGSIVEPTTDPATWEAATGLTIMQALVGEQPLEAARRYADGLSSWLVRRTGGPDEWMIFDRPAGSERDLVILADSLGATIVQRHPAGAVRVAGRFGVLRWHGFDWHHEPPVQTWMDAFTACQAPEEVPVLEALLKFAVHDLGSNRIGALLVYRPHADKDGPVVEERGPVPPPLVIDQPYHRAPLRHALAQVDGAAFFDSEGVLRQLGVRLVPSVDAESQVEPLRGTRHTSARRYSFDDPSAIVVVVSEDGPVSVLRHGEVLGRSPADDADAD